MMTRTVTFISFVLLILGSALLFKVKYTVMGLEDEIKKVRMEIFKKQEDLHILKTELAYLTNPSRVQKLANIKLGWAEEKLIDGSIDASFLNSSIKSDLYKGDNFIFFMGAGQIK